MHYTQINTTRPRGRSTSFFDNARSTKTFSIIVHREMGRKCVGTCLEMTHTFPFRPGKLVRVRWLRKKGLTHVATSAHELCCNISADSIDFITDLPTEAHKNNTVQLLCRPKNCDIKWSSRTPHFNKRIIIIRLQTEHSG